MGTYLAMGPHHLAAGHIDSLILDATKIDPCVSYGASVFDLE
jgi:hypothetical protein